MGMQKFGVTVVRKGTEREGGGVQYILTYGFFLTERAMWCALCIKVSMQKGRGKVHKRKDALIKKSKNGLSRTAREFIKTRW